MDHAIARRFAVAALCCTLAGGAIAPLADAAPGAHPNLTTPAAGSTYHTSGKFANVTFSKASPAYVDVSGGTPNGYVRVAWTMDFEYDSGNVVGTADFDDRVVQLDGTGYWRHDCTLTASTAAITLGSHTGKMYACCWLPPSGPSTGSVYDSHTSSVVSP